MTAETVFGGRAGRPRRNEIESIRTKVWFWAVAARSGLTSGYALEKRFCPDQVKSVHGITKRPCKLDKYKRGAHTPRPALVEKMDQALPGTKSYYEHVFWEAALCPCMSLEGLYDRLLKLPPSITTLLFRRSLRSSTVRERKNRSYMLTFPALAQQGDWDALTACVGLIQEALHYGESERFQEYTRFTLAVFLRLIADLPFRMVAAEFYDYLKRHFLDNPAGKELDFLISEIGLELLARFSTDRLLLIEDLGLLKYHAVAPKSCLYIAEQYLTPDFFFAMWDRSLPGQSGGLDRLSVIRNLARALQRWEARQSLSSNVSHRGAGH